MYVDIGAVLASKLQNVYVVGAPTLNSLYALVNTTPIRKILEALKPRVYVLYFRFHTFLNTVVKERVMKFSDFRLLH